MKVRAWNLCSVALILSVTTSLGAESIGRVMAVQGDVRAIGRDDKARALNLKSDIFLHDRVLTKARAKVQILFDDDSVISQGENSEMTIDDYVYSPKKKKANRTSIKMERGSFRCVTGQITKLNPRKFKVRTRMATIGIRGCDLGFSLSADREQILVLALHGAESVVIDTAGPGLFSRLWGGDRQIDIREPGSLVALAEAQGPQRREFDADEAAHLIDRVTPSPDVPDDSGGGVPDDGPDVLPPDGLLPDDRPDDQPPDGLPPVDGTAVGPEGEGDPAPPDPDAVPVDPDTGEPLPPAPDTGEPLPFDPDTGEPIPFDPDAGEPLPLDPDVGEPIPFDPDAGEPLPLDPDMGEPLPLDPDMGEPLPLDPDTGEPIPFDPGLVDGSLPDPDATDPFADPFADPFFDTFNEDPVDDFSDIVDETQYDPTDLPPPPPPPSDGSGEEPPPDPTVTYEQHGSGADWEWGIWNVDGALDGISYSGQFISVADYQAIEAAGTTYSLSTSGSPVGAIVNHQGARAFLEGTFTMNVMVGNGPGFWSGSFNMNNAAGDDLSFDLSVGSIDSSGTLTGTPGTYSLVINTSAYDAGSLTYQDIHSLLVGPGSGLTPITGVVGGFMFEHNGGEVWIEGALGGDLF